MVQHFYIYFRSVLFYLFLFLCFKNFSGVGGSWQRCGIDATWHSFTPPATTLGLITSLI
ncbi:hypothetical protein Hanom_Chr06g00566251 [Helianthus anomalus]